MEASVYLSWHRLGAGLYSPIARYADHCTKKWGCALSVFMCEYAKTGYNQVLDLTIKWHRRT